MEIVNKISDEDYEYLKTHNIHGLYSSFLSGMPLPAEHGNLVDINDVATALIYSGILRDSAKCGEVKDVLSKIPIIIEGTKNDRK